MFVFNLELLLEETIGLGFKYWAGITQQGYTQLAGHVAFIKSNYPTANVYEKYMELYLPDVVDSPLPNFIYDETVPVMAYPEAVGCSTCGGGKVI